MRSPAFKRLLLAAGVAAAALAAPAQASIVISQVDPYGSASTSTYGADWFVLTNTGLSSQDISGWSMVDNHAASSTATPYASGATISIGNLSGTAKTFGGALLTLADGTTSIAAGQSVVFLESSAVASAAASSTLISQFESAWFGSSVPSNLVVGTFNDGTNYGLSQTADMVNIFNGSSASSALVASVAVGADSGSPLGTFDNSAGLNNTTLTQKSVVGINGARLSATGLEIGVFAAAPVPEPSEWLLLVAGLCLLVAKFKLSKRAHASGMAMA